MVNSDCCEGYAFGLIKKLSNLIIFFLQNFVVNYMFALKESWKIPSYLCTCKGWTEVWIIFRILQCQTLSTAFVTAVLF